MKKLDEEIGEFQGGDRKKREEAIEKNSGMSLHARQHIAVHRRESRRRLRKTISKFISRFQYIEMLR